MVTMTKLAIDYEWKARKNPYRQTGEEREVNNHNESNNDISLGGYIAGRLFGTDRLPPAVL